MSSLPSQQSQQSRPAARRRQRSARLSVAAALLLVAGVVVVGAIASGSYLITALAASIAVGLGAAATRITSSELADARVEAARDRADLAHDYARLTERKTAENMSFAVDMRHKITAREEVIIGLETALSNAQRQVIEQTRKLNLEARRADLAESAQRDGAEAVRGLERSLNDSEGRAAEAIVLVAELEVEIDALKSELTSWQAAAARNRANSA